MEIRRPAFLPDAWNRCPGASQNTRLLPALLPSSAPLDERTEAELLAWTARFSQLVNFFNRENRPEGDWQPFFESQPMVQYALIACQDLESRAAEYGEQLRSWQSTATPGINDTALGNLLTLLSGLCQRVHGWHKFFAPLPTEKIFAGQLTHAIELVLAATLDATRRWTQFFAQRNPALFRTFHFEDHFAAFDSALWRGAEASPGSALDGPADPGELSDLVWAAHRTEALLVLSGRARLAEMQVEPQDLPPHFALYLGFLRQFGHAQKQLNALTGRHLDLYYRKVLEDQPAALAPDRVYVSFVSSPKSGRFQLPAGSALSAKDSAGQVLIYRLAEPVDLTGYTVARAETLWVRGAADPGPDPDAPTAAFQTKAVATPMGNADGSVPPGTAWKPFGQEPSAGASVGAPLGFALASPCFHLESGRRTITLQMNFRSSETEPPGPTGGPVTLAGSAFRIVYSSPAQWATPTRTQDGSEFTLSIQQIDSQHVLATVQIGLAVGDPPCVNFDPAKLAGAFDPRWPVMQILLSNPLPAGGGLMHAFLALLTGAPLTRVGLTASVKGAMALQLYNEQGVIPFGGPIRPFGSAPRVGSSFLVGCPELFRKRVQSLRLHLVWQNLPLDSALYPDGWQGYYRDYIDVADCTFSLRAADPIPVPAAGNPLFRPDQYLVALAYLVDGSWRSWPPLVSPPAADATRDPVLAGAACYPLFPAGNPPPAPPPVRRAYLSPGLARPTSGKIQPETVYETGPWSGLPVDAPVPVAADPALPGASGYLQVRLIAPSYTFGQSMFVNVATAVAVRNARLLAEEVLAEKGSGSTGNSGGGAIAAPAPKLAVAPAMPAVSQNLPDQIIARLRVLVPPTSSARHYQPALFQLSPRLFAALRSSAIRAPDFAAAQQVRPQVAASAIIPALRQLEGVSFSGRAELDELIAGNLGLAGRAATPARPKLLLAIYRWLEALFDLAPVPPMPPNPPPPPGPVMAPLLPNPPLVPTLAKVSIDYDAAAALEFTTPAGDPGACFQVLPFTSRRLPTGGPLAPTLLDAFRAGGYLYLGLANVQPPQTVSLLFVLAEQPGGGAKSPDGPDQPPEWSVLMPGGWRALTPREVRDGTFGLQKSGLVQWSLPEGMDDQGSLMPPGFCWVRGYTPQPERYPAVSQVLPQAGAADWDPAGADPARAVLHLAQPLPAGALKAMQPPDARVKPVLQPLPSFGGRPAETENQFLVRLSERLRHKGRAWTSWDYERLLLQEFPQIFYARCLPHTGNFKPDSAAPQPPAAGEVLVLVLPALRQPPRTLPPGFMAGELQEMEEWLRARASPVVQLRVGNPVYETLQLEAEVVFAPGTPPGLLRSRLNDELQSHISPWIYQPATVARPQVTFNLAHLRDFIQARPYVKAVLGCKLLQPARAGAAGGWLRPSAPWALLITAERHLINVDSPP